jgi:hypothetical protein
MAQRFNIVQTWMTALEYSQRALIREAGTYFFENRGVNV